ncbi:peptide chain release factor 2 [Plesiocystis pacifica SIR-1]|uniref:Peptide chain release factor 2 n=1 Tax=Plesiocystis pacifica SIR-1 TaxID=391625 RepID=A6GJB7_9BACT|nr:peptide chain release factor 2 [Plesiocystis pacifica]EDM74035.1 peptide chain release factor 2 [Plesiocystis pacifica SIR-1]
MSCGGIFDYAGKRERLEEYEIATGDPSFWEDNERAQKILREQSTLKKLVEQIDDVQQTIDDGRELYELGREESDTESIVEAWENLGQADALLGKLEFRRMLSGTHDEDSALLSINAGAGGVDSQDWAEMLLRMYQRWGERQGFDVKVLDIQEGDQAGIRGADLAIEGDYAYGWLRSEIGVHRLVRISPFDSQARRQTSFASIMVLPDLGDGKDFEIEVNPADLRVDKYRASGAGGQHVNKTESAVRLTHEPTGIVVACQMERSQHKNMATAMRMLKAKLWDLEQQRRSDEISALEGDKKAIEWGSQIRSYVIHPYQQVNDHRTELKQGNVDAVLDGDLGSYMEAFLLMQGNAGK